MDPTHVDAALDTQESKPEPYVSPFIEDGYTAEYTIPAIPGISSAVFIRYRPITAEDESIVRAKARGVAEANYVRLYAELMAGRHGTAPKLLGWDLKDGKGEVLKITADNICRLKEQMFDALYAAMKLGGSDVKNS